MPLVDGIELRPSVRRSDGTRTSISNTEKREEQVDDRYMVIEGVVQRHDA